MIQLKYHKDRYYLKCQPSIAFMAKQVGFRHLKEDVWVTKNPLSVKQMVKYADRQTKERFDYDWRRFERYFKNSYASDAELDFSVPEGESLLPYQRAGIAQLRDIIHGAGGEMGGAFLADEMGLGKTVQVIGYLNHLQERDPAILVVCPCSLKINWKQELRKWLTRPFTYAIAAGDYLPAAANITIINYDILKKFHEQLSKRTWDLIAADEAHFVKNAGAQRSKAFYDLKAKERIAMTGTPIVNNIGELFSILNWLQPEVFHSRSWFKSTYKNREEELGVLLRGTVMVRRLKSEVLKELPPKRRHIVTLPADGAEKVIEAELFAYEKHKSEVEVLEKAVLTAKEANNTEAYKQATKELRKAQITLLAHVSKERERVAKAKLPSVIAHLKNCIAQEGKVVVFAHHRSVTGALLKTFSEHAVGLIGGMSEKDKNSAVEMFQRDEKTKLFVGSITAAGVGVTLTAASHVVFAELDWVPHTLSQAEDRCHRIGQKDYVFVQHLVLEGSLDAIMVEKIIQKQELQESVLNVR